MSHRSSGMKRERRNDIIWHVTTWHDNITWVRWHGVHKKFATQVLAPWFGNTHGIRVLWMFAVSPKKLSPICISWWAATFPSKLGKVSHTQNWEALQLVILGVHLFVIGSDYAPEKEYFGLIAIFFLLQIVCWPWFDQPNNALITEPPLEIREHTRGWSLPKWITDDGARVI